MDLNEIKKVLYREKPIAHLQHQNEILQYEENATKCYIAKSSIGIHEFRIPVSDMRSIPFERHISAQLLIRWIVDK